MIYKIYNKADQGDYNNGITPQQITDEFAFLPLVPIGDTRDVLIQQVLQTISNENLKTRSAVNTTGKTGTLRPKYIGSSYQTIPIEVNAQDKSEK